MSLFMIVPPGIKVDRNDRLQPFEVLVNIFKRSEFSNALKEKIRLE